MHGAKSLQVFERDDKQNETNGPSSLFFVKSICCHTKPSQQLLPTATDSEQRYGVKQLWAVPAQGAAAGRSSRRHVGSAGDRRQCGFCIIVVRGKPILGH